MRRDVREVWLQLTAVDIKILEMFDYLERVGGSIFPSQKWLADKLCVSERTIRRGVAHLKTLGVVLVQPQRRRDRQGRVRSHNNRYRILGLCGAFIRGLLARLTGRTRTASVNKTKKKKELSESLHEEKGTLSPEILRKIPILGRWMERGGA